MRRTKAAKMTFVPNIRAYNVDEIDHRMFGFKKETSLFNEMRIEQRKELE